MCLELIDVCHQYEAGKPVLHNVCATFERGQVTAIMGQSGAGKSTLLSLISGLAPCGAGEILYNGKSLRTMDLDRYRAQSIGVIFQSYNLLENSSALYNITFSMQISGAKRPGQTRREFAMQLLSQVGIDAETAKRKVTALSGGQRQRVGIARALSHNPDIIIADEPTGNLDGKAEAAILEILTDLAHEAGKCVIIVTHSDNVCAIADRVVHIADGRILEAS